MESRIGGRRRRDLRLAERRRGRGPERLAVAGAVCNVRVDRRTRRCRRDRGDRDERCDECGGETVRRRFRDANIWLLLESTYSRDEVDPARWSHRVASRVGTQTGVEERGG